MIKANNLSYVGESGRNTSLFRMTKYLIVLVCIAMAMFSCDDTNEPNKPVPTDAYIGTQRQITLGAEMKGFTGIDFECVIKAEDGTVFRRSGSHIRINGKSILTLDTGLKSGVYRLLALEVPTVDAESDTTWVDYGLGCRVRISAETQTAIVLDSYDPEMNLVGEGSEDDPYIISSAEHLWRLRDYTNNDDNNKKLTKDTHFRMEADIRMKDICTSSDRHYGWLPIGSIPENPFRGVFDGQNYKIHGLWIDRPHSPGVGLFGFIDQATIKNVIVSNPDITGNYAVGAIVGGTTSPGDIRGCSSLHGCVVDRGSVTAPEGSAGVGGLVGVVDCTGFLSVDSCYNAGTRVSGDYAVGGIVGAGSLYSMTQVLACENKGSVEARYTGVGGIVGSVDSLMIIGCKNNATINGGTGAMSGNMDKGGYGTGGIAGGTGVSFIYSSQNTGNITGAVGVGGIIGSTRVGNDDSNYEGELLYNNSLVKNCGNTGNISGRTSVGGICGEAQFGAYAVYNKGAITAADNQCTLGGIVGNTSITVLHNVINQGTVTSTSAESAAGVVGKTTWGALYGCQNYGNVAVTSKYAGGIAGWVGNNTVANYCLNTGLVNNNGTRATGGIIGEAGDARVWTGMDIAGCVIGAAECVMVFAGPVLSVTGNAVTQNVVKHAEAFKKFFHVLHVGEATLDWAMVAYDAVTYSMSLYDIFTEEDLNEINVNLNTKATAIDNDVKATIKSIQDSYVFDAAKLPQGINGAAITGYFDNFNKAMDFYQASDDNNSIINYNLNRTREERVGELEHRQEIKEIVQKSIAGTCIIVGSVASIVASFATAGTMTAVSAGIMASILTFVGGANAMVECATNFEVNAIVVNQCTNLGTIKTTTSDYVGGILGYTQQNCKLTDCLNVGNLDGNINNAHAGGITGEADYRSVIMRNVSVGTNWFNPIAAHAESIVDYSDNFYYSGGTYAVLPHYTNATSVTLEQLHDKKFFEKALNLSGSIPLWQITDKSGFFPIPYHSEMEAPIQ